MTDSARWRVAIIGSGPSGFYAAQELLKQSSWDLDVDLFERLLTPYGLVRGGVAPDHQKIKSVTRIFDRVAQQPGFRFFGNVEFGKDLTREDFLAHYDAILYTVGSSTDRHLNIPGEELSGSHSATEFVAWYNGHPDFRERAFGLQGKSAIVIGVGNVAVDVARILSHDPEFLATTDIAAHALQALRDSTIEDVYLIGRRGPVQAAFTPTEVRELSELTQVDVIVRPEDLELDEGSQQELDAAGRQTAQNLDLLREMSQRTPSGRPKRLHFLFCASPVELHGDDGKVRSMKLVRNRLEWSNGRTRAVATGETFELPANLVFRAVGYRGEPLPGVAFDERSGTIPHEKGKVLNPEGDGREYVAGWIKRGPSGVVGTNKPCAVESAQTMLQTFLDEQRRPLGAPDVTELLSARSIRYVSHDDWKRLDEHEVQTGQALGRPRLKLTDPQEMLKILENA